MSGTSAPITDTIYDNDDDNEGVTYLKYYKHLNFSFPCSFQLP